MTEDFDVTYGQGPRWNDVDPRKVQGFLQGLDARIKTLCKELKGLGNLLEHQSNWIGDLQAAMKPQDAAAVPPHASGGPYPAQLQVPLKPGWYWVKSSREGMWIMALRREDKTFVACLAYPQQIHPAVIGPRIEEPK